MIALDRQPATPQSSGVRCAGSRQGGGLCLLTGAARQVSRAVAWLLLVLLVAYQRLISPLLGPHCRFTPTCSGYARDCLRRYGLVRGLGKTAWRLMRCHPLCKGGYDPP